MLLLFQKRSVYGYEEMPNATYRGKRLTFGGKMIGGIISIQALRYRKSETQEQADQSL